VVSTSYPVLNNKKNNSNKPDLVVHTYNPALRRLRQEDHEFRANLGYIVRFCVKKQNKQPTPPKKLKTT
jgi:hypothetical protein